MSVDTGHAVNGNQVIAPAAAGHREHAVAPPPKLRRR